MHCFGTMKNQGMMSWSVVTLSFILITLLMLDGPVLTSAALANYNFPHCGVCDESKCPELHYCEGKAIKDHCQCCMVCSDNSFQPHISLSTGREKGDACEQVKCPNLKVCVENVQGLPLCECPGEHMCRRSKKRELCGTDGMTYPSRCHMRIASCNQGIHIRKLYRGTCKPEDTPVDAAAYRKKLKKLKRRKMRRRRQRRREAASGGKKRTEEEIQRRKEKRRRKRRKSGNRKYSKSRMRRHRKVNLDKLAWENNFGLATWN